MSIGNPWKRSRALQLGCVVLLWACLTCATSGQDLAQTDTMVDATTLNGKALCGYQGWFRCPDDGTNSAWLHWSRRRSISPESLTFEMWPDLSEFTPEEKFAVPGFTHADGSQAFLYSSANPKTIHRHFQWMQQYGIDGVFVQRFLVNLRQPSFDSILQHVRSSAEKTGRVYGVCYDLSGYPADRIVERLTSDWKALVDQRKVTSDGRYVHHEGRPVVFIWGLYPDRFDAEIAHQLIDFFHEEGPYQATVIGGCPWNWQREGGPRWAAAFRKLDVLSPWNHGNVVERRGKKVANTEVWKDDIQVTGPAGVAYLPVVYPGFAWTNLKGANAEGATIDRRGGEFFWEQCVAAAKLKTGMIYVAMFDEVDEATAIYKVTNNPPQQAHFKTYEGLPSDWYLRLTGEATKMIRGEIPITEQLPITPN